MLTTTVGQMMVNRALPADMRDYNRVLDAGGTQTLLAELAQRHPDKYKDTLKQLTDAGRSAATATGGHSFGASHLRPTQAALMARHELRYRLKRIMQNPQLSDDERRDHLTKAISDVNDGLQKRVFEEAKQTDNPLAKQVLSGARGSVSQLNMLIGGQMLQQDHRGRDIPYPVTHTFTEGLTPAEWYAIAYSSRKGLVGTKLGTAKSGFFAKQLNQINHRLMVVADDDEEESKSLRGMPVDVDDEDNAGALLAAPVGGYRRNTELTPKILADLQRQGIKRMLVRSPIVGGPGDGVYAKDVGVREYGRLPNLGDLVGLTAAQAISERVTQKALGSKHRGSGQGVGGFEYIQSQLSVPKHMKGGATHADADGRVTKIEDTGTGGKRVWIGDTPHFIDHGYESLLNIGDEVEAGDVISDGIPNPRKVVEHKGIGEGRRYFVSAFKKALKAGNTVANRRNIELLARGAIDHVSLTDPNGDMLPGDIMSYSQLERNWQPREGHQSTPLQQAAGHYLEQPVLHYSVGTKLRPSVIKNLQEFGVNQVAWHNDPPPFAPVMTRSMAVLGHDQDVMTRLYGSGHKKSLLEATHRGQSSDTSGTSFVPALAEGVPFDQDWPDAVLQKHQSD